MNGPTTIANSVSFFRSDRADSLMQIDHAPLEDAYDYFGGPDLGEDFSHPSRKRQRTHDVRDDDIHDEDDTSHSDAAADSIPVARSVSWRPSPSPSPADTPRQAGTDMPVVVVNEENGAVEERQERSRESSPSRSPVMHRLPEQERAPSPPLSTAIPIPRTNPAHSHLISSSISSTVTPSSMP